MVTTVIEVMAPEELMVALAVAFWSQTGTKGVRFWSR